MSADEDTTEAWHLPDNGVTAWVDELRDPTPQEADHIGQLIDEAMERELGRPLRKPSPRVAAMTMTSVYARQDVQDATNMIKQHIDQGLASLRLLTCWRRHLLAEQRHTSACAPAKDAAKVGWRTAAPTLLQRFVDDLDIELVPSLGGVLASAVFTGPNRIRIVLAEDAIKGPAEAEFCVYHMFLHACVGGAATTGFGCWLEFQREATDPRVVVTLQDPTYCEEEATINDGATCLMDVHYATSQIAPLGRSLLRRALTRQFVDLHLLRAVLGGRQNLLNLIDAKVSAIYHSVAGTPVESLLRPRLCFTQHIAIVRESWWRPIYLIWADSAGNLRRRLVPSRKVLKALGGRLDDIPTVSASQLNQYTYEGVLIDPTEVATVHKALLKGTALAWPVVGGCLPGLGQKRSSLDLPRPPQQSRLDLPPPHNWAKSALDNGTESAHRDDTLVAGNAGGRAN